MELFAGLDRLALAQLAGYLDPVAVRAGDTLFRQGDPSDALYVVANGALGAYVTAGAGESRLNTLSAGDCLGEMGILTAEPRSATIRADTSATVLRLGRDAVLDVVLHEPLVAHAVMVSLSRRLRASDAARLQGDLAIHRHLEEALDELDGARRQRLAEAGLLTEVTDAALHALFGMQADEVAADLARVGLVAGRLPPAAIRALRAQRERELGPDGALQVARAAGERLAAAAYWDEALAILARLPAAAVLGLAAWIGSGPLMVVFLNASAAGLLAWGLLPEASRIRFDWLSWHGGGARGGNTLPPRGSEWPGAGRPAG